MVIVVLGLAVAITAYVGWLMWNAPEDEPRPPGVSRLQPLYDAIGAVRRPRARRREMSPAMRHWEHRSTT